MHDVLSSTGTINNQIGCLVNNLRKQIIERATELYEWKRIELSNYVVGKWGNYYYAQGEHGASVIRQLRKETKPKLIAYILDREFRLGEFEK